MILIIGVNSEWLLHDVCALTGMYYSIISVVTATRMAVNCNNVDLFGFSGRMLLGLYGTQSQ